MFGIIVNIAVFLFVLGLVIMIHEFGHFIMAKRANILCHEFSLGMGPIVWSKKKGETLYAVRAIPFGGYVMMAGEEIQDELIKVGKKVRLISNDSGIVEKIVLDPDLEGYEDYELIEVNNVDLSGLNGEALTINDHTVKRDAFYVFKKQELQVAPTDRSFQSKTKLQRFLAIFAGPFMNFVLAFFLFITIGLVAGFANVDNSILGEIDENMPAFQELSKDDEILSINGTTVTDWDDIKAVLNDNVTDRTIAFEVDRDGVNKTILVTPVIYFYSVGFHSDYDTVNILKIGDVPVQEESAFLNFFYKLFGKDIPEPDVKLETGDIITHVDGVEVLSWYGLAKEVEDNTDNGEITFTVVRNSSSMDVTIESYNTDLVNSQGLNVVESRVGITPNVEFSFFKSIKYGFTGVKDASAMIFTTLDLLFTNDDVGVGDLAGPIGIYQITSQALSRGFISFLSWTALLSVNLAVINLLPIPALDGGRLVFLGYEVVTRKKPNQKIENTLHYLMFILLMGLFVVIAFSDVARLLNIK